MSVWWWPLGILIALALVGGVWVELIRRRELRPFLSRRCAGIRWHRRFPDASIAEIRDFVSVFTCCFGIRQKHQLAFRPDDRVMDIYRALYPPGWTIADAMELEDLAIELNKRFGVNLDEVWHDGITLGELFDRMRR